MFARRGLDVLQECESRLRAILAEAATAGNYEDVLQLTQWAQGVVALETGPLPTDRACTNSSPTVRDRGGESNHPSPTESTPTKKSARPRTKTAVRRSRWKRKGIAAYPKFARFRDELIKIGWSRKAKKEYQHKAPREVVDSLVDRLINVSVPGEIFSTEQLFPLRDREGESEIPSYQAYLCLAWLRSIGLVHQHGRRGYSTVRDIDAPSLVVETWSKLPVVRP